MLGDYGQLWGLCCRPESKLLVLIQIVIFFLLHDDEASISLDALFLVNPLQYSR